MLSITGLCAGYGRLSVLRDLDLSASAGELSVIVGRNGAGKTTLMGAIMGQVRTTAGSVEWKGVSLRNLRPDQIVRRGVVLVPQSRGLFFGQTVTENLELSRFALPRSRRQGFAAELSNMFDMFPSLARRRHVLAVNLSGGEQQMLAIAKALLAQPSVLLLDEPSIGLAPAISAELAVTLRELKSDSRAIVLAEQNIHWALAVADNVQVLDEGRIAERLEVAGRDPAALVARLASSYLGSVMA